MSSVIFCNYFEDGDGLLTVDMDADNHNDQEISKVKLFRLLLTESGHYLLPTDEPTKHKLRDGIKQDVTAFFNKVATQATQPWQDVCPRMKHCFLSSRPAPLQQE